MSKAHRIVRVEHTATNVRIILDDGSQLVGVISANSASTICELTTVELKAYVFNT